MKASDICVGDWLNIYTFPNDNPKKDDLFPAMVSAVSVFDQFKDPDDVTVELVIPNTNGIASRPLGTCLPIKLTEDILVKNGFASSEGYAYLHLDENNFLEFCYYNHRLSKIYMGIEIDDWNKRVTVRDVVFVSNCNYVHEFQHDLKRCGIEKEVQL